MTGVQEWGGAHGHRTGTALPRGRIRTRHLHRHTQELAQNRQRTVAGRPTARTATPAASANLEAENRELRKKLVEKDLEVIDVLKIK